MQQKQFLFCVFFLTIIIILQLIMGMFDTYRILAIIYIMFIILAIVYSSYSNYLAIQISTGLASLLPINSLLAASIMGKLWLSCLIIQQLARGGNLNLAITTKVLLAQLGQQLSILCFLFILEELASYNSQLYFLLYFKHFSFINDSYLIASYRKLRIIYIYIHTYIYIYIIYNFAWKT